MHIIFGIVVCFLGKICFFGCKNLPIKRRIIIILMIKHCHTYTLIFSVAVIYFLDISVAKT